MALAFREENQKINNKSLEIEDDSTVDYDGGTDHHEHCHQQQCGEQANLVHPGGNRGGHGGFPPAAVGGSPNERDKGLLDLVRRALKWGDAGQTESANTACFAGGIRPE